MLEMLVYLIICVCGVIFIVNEKSNIFKDKYGFVVEIAQIAVRAAEKLAEEKAWTGPEKFNYVYDILKKYAKDLDEKQIQSIIESAVYELSKEK